MESLSCLCGERKGSKIARQIHCVQARLLNHDLHFRQIMVDHQRLRLRLGKGEEDGFKER